MLGFPPALRRAWQRQDSNSNIQLPTFKVSIPGGPADSNIPSWSGNGETCPWQKLLNQADGQGCDHQRTGQNSHNQSEPTTTPTSEEATVPDKDLQILAPFQYGGVV